MHRWNYARPVGQRVVICLILIGLLAALGVAAVSAQEPSGPEISLTYTFRGVVFVGSVGVETTPLAGAVIELWASNNAPSLGTKVDSLTTLADGVFEVSASSGYEYYTLIEKDPSGYVSAGAVSPYGIIINANQIQFSGPFRVTTFPDNKFWDTSTTRPTSTLTPSATPTNTPPVRYTATSTVKPSATLTNTPFTRPTQEPSSTPTRTLFPLLTPLPTNTPFMILTPIPINLVDLVAGKLEVTQGVQDLNNSVRLVENKRTYVRFHVTSDWGMHATTAWLVVNNGSSSYVLLPENPGTEINVRTSPDRGTLDHAFLFELPDDYTEGNVSMTAYLNPYFPILRDRDPKENNYGNNESSVSVHFEEVDPVNLVVYRVGYEWGGTTYYPTSSERAQLVDYMERAYPVSQINATYRSAYASPATVSGGDLTWPQCGDVNGFLLSQWVNDVLYGGYSTGTHYYGMVDDGGGFMRGCASGIPSLVASGPTGTSSWGWDYDGSYGDWYGAHELCHTYGRYHAEFCGASGGIAYPYSSGRISPATTGNTAIYGFDIGNQSIYPPTSKDIMTYCDDLWFSDFTYEGLMSYFQSHVTSASLSANLKAVPQLLVTGIIDLSLQQATLDPMMVLIDPAQVILPTPGDYAIVLRGPTGAELARYAFTPAVIADGPARPDQPETDLALATINEMVPSNPDTARVEIVYQGEVIGFREAGLGRPLVQVVAPNGGEVVAGNPVVVSWTASDPDHDPLTFAVHYSNDNGATWQRVANNLTGNSVAIDAENVPAGLECLFRVMATDGIHMGMDTSDAPFGVPNHLPTVHILSPEDGYTMAVSQTLTLKGDAYDIDTGTMTDEQVTWHSDLGGALGEGDELHLSGLQVGEHTITLRADDGLGGVATAVVHVNVVSDPSGLEVPDLLTVSPPNLILDKTRGVLAAELAIENGNVRHQVFWQAASSEPWLHVATDVGLTPQLLVVSMDAMLASGSYAGELVITSPDLPGQVVTVAVQALGGPAPVSLPLIMRG